VGGADETVRRKLAETLADGTAKGESNDELRDRVKKVYNVADSRASLIARQEVGAAVEEARAVGRVQAGVPMKSWLWSQKKEGRASHAATETATREKPIPASEKFTIAGTTMTCDHPRDSSLPPEQSINCACTTLARYPNDSTKSIVARYLAHGFLDYEGMQKLDARRASLN